MGRKYKKKQRKSHACASDKEYQPARFALEHDAEDIFLEAFENIGASHIVDKENSSDIEKSTKSKNRNRKDRSRNSSGKTLSIDLHGCTLSEAQTKIDHFFSQLLVSGGQSFQIRVVTGKGLHSEGSNGVLAKEIHGYVVANYRSKITRIQESPHLVKVDGVPIRGHFDLTFQT